MHEQRRQYGDIRQENGSGIDEEASAKYKQLYVVIRSKHHYET